MGHWSDDAGLASGRAMICLLTAMRMPDAPPPRDEKPLLDKGVLVGLCLVAALCYFSAMWRATAGSPSPPLDDSFIHFQYAREMARGRFLQYNGDGPVTTGATSLLYVMLLAPYFWLPFPGSGVVLYAFVLGAAGLIASTLLVRAIVANEASRGAGLLAGVLFACNGYVLWGYLSGMEVALFGTLVLVLLRLIQRGAQPPPAVGQARAPGVRAPDTAEGRCARHQLVGLPEAIIGSLLALTRPEGAILACLLLGLVVAWQWRECRGRIGYAAYGFALVPVAVAASQFGLYWLLTGSPLMAGQVAKDLLHEPGMTASEFLRQFAAGFVRVTFRDIGWRMVQPAAFAMMLLAAVMAVAREAALRRLGWHSVACAWMILGVAATCTLMEPNLHHNRYQTALSGLFIVYAALGWHFVCSQARAIGLDGKRSSVLFCAGGVGLTVLALCQAFAMGLQYGRHCGEIHAQHMRMGQAIAQTLPENATVATHDAGAIRFLGRRKVYDLIGLVTPNDPRTGRHGVASLYEEMEALPKPRRPTHFAVFPGWVDFQRFGLLRPILSVPLFRPTIALPELCLYESDWALAGSGDTIHNAELLLKLRGYTCVDRLDVADVASERAHGYRVDIGGSARVPKTFLMCGTVAGADGSALVIDAGRCVALSESWQAAVTPHRDTIVAMRSLCVAEDRLAKAVTGQSDAWVERIVVESSAAQIDTPKLPVKMCPVWGTELQSFHYWVYQKL